MKIYNCNKQGSFGLVKRKSDDEMIYGSRKRKDFRTQYSHTFHSIDSGDAYFQEANEVCKERYFIHEKVLLYG